MRAPRSWFPAVCHAAPRCAARLAGHTTLPLASQARAGPPTHPAATREPPPSCSSLPLYCPAVSAVPLFDLIGSALPHLFLLPPTSRPPQEAQGQLGEAHEQLEAASAGAAEKEAQIASLWEQLAAAHQATENATEVGRPAVLLFFFLLHLSFPALPPQTKQLAAAHQAAENATEVGRPAFFSFLFPSCFLFLFVFTSLALLLRSSLKR